MGLRGPVRRPRRGAPPRQGPLPRERRPAPRHAPLRRRSGRDRQVAAVVGVREVHRRPGGGHLVAPRPLPLLRRRAWRTGPSPRWCAGAPRSPRTRTPPARWPSSAPHSSCTSRTRAEQRVDRAAAAPPAGPGRPQCSRPRGSLLRVAALLRAPCRAGAARDGVRGHPLGRRRADRLHRVPPRLEPAPFDLRPHPRAAGDGRPSPRLPRRRAGAPRRCRSSRSRTRRWTSCSSDSCRGCRRPCESGCVSAADGIPLYAVETVRMLRDRGLIDRRSTARSWQCPTSPRSRSPRRCTR